MATDPIKTPAELADEARQAGRDALSAAQGYAREARDIGREAAQSIRPALDEARATGREAADTLRGIAGDARDIAEDAAATGRTYARKAVNAAGREIGGWRQRLDNACEDGANYVAREPGKALLWAAAGGALLATLLYACAQAGAPRVRRLRADREHGWRD